MSPNEMSILRDAERKLIQAELHYLAAVKNPAKTGNLKEWKDFQQAKNEYLALVRKSGMNQEEASSSLSEVSNIV